MSVAQLARAAVEAEARAAAARAARDDAMREARAAGVSVAQLVAETGLTRARVTQILAGRRTLSRSPE